jgi:peptide/nickel transport system permease protein
MPTLFWTDALFFLLLAVLAALVFYGRDKEHLRRPWQKIATSKSGMVSLVILLAFLLVGVLDSIHFYPILQDIDGKQQRGIEPISVFDAWTTPLRTRDEKTYSAPFAAYAYAREYVRGADGRQRWDYPRLQYGGAHLENPEEEKSSDILSTAAIGAGKGLLLWSALCAALLAPPLIRHRQPLKAYLSRILLDRTPVPWRIMLVTLFIIVVAGYALAELSLSYHVLGTDKVGQDVFYQSLKSIRTGLIIGTLTTIIMLPFALLLGIVAGYFRGWADDTIQYIYTTLNSIPDVLLIAAAILMMQVYMAKHEDDFASLALRADLRLLFLCLILGITRWTGLCRLLRAETLKLREMEYIQAAKALGVRQGTILLRHILPNVFHIVLITVTLDFSGLVLAEAVLSYINIGVDPTMPSWGNMINSARLEIAREPIVWWSLTAAFLFMFTLVLAANLFADVVRDAFDPRREANIR